MITLEVFGSIYYELKVESGRLFALSSPWSNDSLTLGLKFCVLIMGQNLHACLIISLLMAFCFKPPVLAAAPVSQRNEPASPQPEARGGSCRGAEGLN